MRGDICWKRTAGGRFALAGVGGEAVGEIEGGCGARPMFRCLVSDTTYVYSIMTLLLALQRREPKAQNHP